MIVCITRSPTSAIYFLIRKQQPAVRQIATGMLAHLGADTITGTHTPLKAQLSSSQPDHPAQRSSGQRREQRGSGFAAWCC
jgi:hypothetical protein